VRSSVTRIRADLDALARFSSPGRGTTRLSFTPEYWAAIDYVAGQLAALGYGRTITSHGNTRFRRPDTDWTTPAIVVGSHLDTVPEGGRFDGTAGIVAGVEIARLLAESASQLPAPYEVIVFAEEEGARFGNVLAGSRAMTGQLTGDALTALVDREGIAYQEAVGARGRESEPSCRELLDAARIAAYFELHIEQSLVLEEARVPIGIVQAIAGIRQFRVQFMGCANHAGATPMHLRTDTLAAAAEAIQMVEATATTAAGASVGTVGAIVNEPNASNVISGRTSFSIDLRDIDPVALEERSEKVVRTVADIAERRRIEAVIETGTRHDPVVLSPRLRSALADSAARQGIDCMDMPSGAVHDAQAVAQIAECAMVFVPSLAGRSHCPEEDTPYEAIGLGVDVILDAALRSSVTEQSRWSKSSGQGS